MIMLLHVSGLSSSKIGRPTYNCLARPPSIILEQAFISLLQTCHHLKLLLPLHAQVVTHGLEHDQYVAPKMVAAASDCGSIGYARQLFDQILNPNVFLWNALVRGYANNQLHREAILAFRSMMRWGVKPNEHSFHAVIRSCCGAAAASSTIVGGVHCLVLKSGFMWNEFVGTGLIELYGQCRDMGSAYGVFSEMSTMNVVAWTAVVSGYILCGDLVRARGVFDRMQEQDVVVWGTMISGYVEAGDMVSARCLFDGMPKSDRDVMCWNIVLTGYANNGDFEESEKLLGEMPHKNVYSWNGLMAGYAKHGLFLEAFGVLDRMLSEGNVAANEYTIVMVVSACARLGSLYTGRRVHLYAQSNGFGGNLYVNNCLIDMYAKCGCIEAAMLVFKAMGHKDLVTWNAMVNSLAIHGRGDQALDTFIEMKRAGEKPDCITFVGVLSACAHMGLVETGFSYFQEMIDHYSLIPQIEHYGCMVDLLGRAGQLFAAMDFVKSMPMEPDSVIWSTLLAACRVHKNLDLAEFALKQLIHLEPTNVANHVLLSNMYGALGRWEEMAMVKLMMKGVGVKKLPGSSQIQVNGGVAEFFSSDKNHSRANEIYEALHGLNSLLKLVDRNIYDHLMGFYIEVYLDSSLTK